ncbi:MAG: MerR family transcriptional regulator [Pseudomonadota bacterium]
MRMRELVKATGVSKEMIHYFSREGLLPEVDRPSANQAIYGPEHVDRIFLIKKLQEKLFLPINLIKEILDQQDESGLDEELLTIKTDYFKAVDHLLPGKIVGEDAFLEYTGMSRSRLADFEEYKVIRFEMADGVKVYSHDAVKLGRVIGDMRKRGLSHENGLNRTMLKEVHEMLQPIFEHMTVDFEEALDRNDFSPEERQKLALSAVELMPLFFYHTVHNYLEKAKSRFLK